MRKILLICVLMAYSFGVRAQLIAAGTELTSDALLMPNLSLEMVTGNKTSLNISVMGTTNSYIFEKVKGIVLQPEYRYWFSGRPISRFFVGVGAIGGLFDITSKGKVYDGYGMGGGLTYGYVINVKTKVPWLKDRLNIDIHSGFGAIYYHRKEYFVNDNFDVDYTKDNYQRANANGYYLLPTRVGVSVVYIFN